MNFFLHVQHEDDLLAIIDRVLTAPEDDIVLVIPSGARFLASEENLLLLKREAEAGGKRVSLQTNDPRGRALGTKLGIAIMAAPMPRRVFSDIVAPGALPPTQQPMPRPPTQQTAIEEPVVVEEPEAEEVPTHVDQVEQLEDEQSQGALPLEGVPDEPLPFLQPTTRAAPKGGGGGRRFIFTMPGKLGSRAGAIFIVLAGVAVAFLVANEVLPNVEVLISPKTDTVAFSMPITVSVGDAGGDVPGQRVQVTASEERTVPASGEAEVVERASGRITITNAFSSDSQALVATTRFVSQDGKLFRLDKTVVVPGAEVIDGKIVPSTIEATVSADEPGPEYNIGPSTFSIPGFQGSPKFNKFTARSSEAMSGGAKGTVKIVTSENVVAAREGIEEALAIELERAFSAQVVAGLVVAEGAREITTTINLDHESEDIADSVTARAEGTLAAIAYRAQDLEDAVLAVLEGRIPADTDVIPGSTTITPTITAVDSAAGTLVLEVSVQAQAAWRVDEELVRDAIAGRDEIEIRSWLGTYDAVHRARAVFRPFWVKVAPENPERIRVTVGLDIGLDSN